MKKNYTLDDRAKDFEDLVNLIGDKEDDYSVKQIAGAFEDLFDELRMQYLYIL